MDCYETVLKEYNFLSKDEIIGSFKISTKDDYNEFIKLKNIDIDEDQYLKSVFKQKSEIMIFLMTKDYNNSNLFDENLKLK